MKNFYNLKNIKKIKWGLLEENKPISLYPIMYPGWCSIIQNMGKILGKHQKSIICLHQRKSGLIFIDHKEWNDLGKFVLQKIIKNPQFAIKLNKEILKFSDDLVNFTEKKIFNADLTKKTNIELVDLYKEYEKRHGDLYSRAIIPVYLELYKPHLTDFLVKYLEKQIEKYNYSKTAKECFAILTVPARPSKTQLEEKLFLKIALEIKRNKGFKELFGKSTEAIIKDLNPLDTKLAGKIKKHINDYKHLGYNFEGPPFPDQYFIERWKEILKKKENISKLIGNINRERSESEKQEKIVMSDLKIDSKHQNFFQIAKEIIYGKDYRKMGLVRSYYQIEPLLREIGRRAKLTLGEVRNCLLDELEDISKDKVERPKDLSNRMKGCLFVVIDRKLPGRVFVDQIFIKTRKYLERKKDFSEVNYFHGQTAATGKARGIVKVINAIKDLSKMNKGDILVSQMTNPDLVPAMKKAAAIITDLGGITCHAAIVSRELKIPCVIGTKIATQALKDGDRVFVDADQGEVKKIN